MLHREIYVVGGQVQGVGFRPFIFRDAERLGLTGFIRNTPDGVYIEVQGPSESLEAFSSFPSRLPPLASIASLSHRKGDIVANEQAFRILHTLEGDHSGHAVLISPDVAPCANCLADMTDPANRRYGYAFTNCTDCGPRYSITHSLPYDRPTTCMACFPQCRQCSAEYHYPGDRRFHAQPNACPQCGPELWLEWNRALYDVPAQAQQRHHPRLATYGLFMPAAFGSEAIVQLLKALLKGCIAAVKGLGGFHLVCNALDDDAVLRLRQRKQRPHKPLAVMVGSLTAAAKLADIGPEGSSIRALLCSPARPIVICPCRHPHDTLSPDTATIGLMLPSTPLHHVLFHPELCGGKAKDAPEALVMTSGNPHNAPLCLSNREAKRRLNDMADLFLFHDRDIVVRVDDSVIFPALPGKANALSSMVRRARGFVPTPLILSRLDDGKGFQSIYAAGAELKSTFCLTRKKAIFVSQHIGDLTHAECMDFYAATLDHLQKILEVSPQAVVCDKHPDYASHIFARSFAQKRQIPLFALQHHAAHIYAVMAEHDICHPVLGMALDGSGFGDDGTIWGGELLLMDGEKWRRMGRFSPFPLPGGEAAIKSPWRVASGLWLQNGLTGIPPWQKSHGQAMPMLQQMIARNVNCPLTSSCGRLFDAVAALAGVCFDITYEGQAAIRLEQLQNHSEQGSYVLPIKQNQGLIEADAHAFFRQAAQDMDQPHNMARRFHRGLAEGLSAWARHAADSTGIKQIVLAGGVFNNRTLLSETQSCLVSKGLTPVVPSAYPAGDGSIALGQAYWGTLMRMA